MVAVAKFSRHSFSDEMTSVFLNSFFGFCCPSAPSFLRVYAKENAGVGGALDLEIDPSAFKQKIQTKKTKKLFLAELKQTNKHIARTQLCVLEVVKNLGLDATTAGLCFLLLSVNSYITLRNLAKRAKKRKRRTVKETAMEGKRRRIPVVVC